MVNKIIIIINSTMLYLFLSIFAIALEFTENSIINRQSLGIPLEEYEKVFPILFFIFATISFIALILFFNKKLSFKFLSIFNSIVTIIFIIIYTFYLLLDPSEHEFSTAVGLAIRLLLPYWISCFALFFLNYDHLSSNKADRNGEGNKITNNKFAYLSNNFSKRDYQSMLSLSNVENAAKRISYVILFLIFLSIGTITFLILQAGKIVSQDTASTNVVQIAESRLETLKFNLNDYRREELRLSQNRKGLEINLPRLYQELKTAKNIFNQKNSPILSEVQPLKINQLQDKIDSNEIDLAGLSTKEDQLNQKIKETKEQITTTSKVIDRTSVSPNNNEHDENGSWQGSVQILFTAGLTRIGIMILGIYLIRFLVQLYQYNVQLADEYHTKWQTLLLLDLNSEKYNKTLEVLKSNTDWVRPKFTDRDKILEGIPKAVSDAMNQFKKDNPTT